MRYYKRLKTTLLTTHQAKLMQEEMLKTKALLLSMMGEHGMSAFDEDESYPSRKRRAEQHSKNMDAGRLKLPARKRQNEDKRGRK